MTLELSNMRVMFPLNGNSSFRHTACYNSTVIRLNSEVRYRNSDKNCWSKIIDCASMNFNILIDFSHNFFFLWRYSPNLNSPFHFGLLDLRYSVALLGRVISSSQDHCTQTQKNAHTQTLNIHALSGIRTHDPGFRASEDSACLRPLGHRERPHILTRQK
jgi:hypothetical protein